MSETSGTKNWLTSLQGLLTTLAALITALATLIAAVPQLRNAVFPATPEHVGGQNCTAGYVWRLAWPEDHVCVSEETHLRALQDNMLAGSRRNPAGGPYGADSCLAGYVWRDAFNGDHVCVTPETRALAAQDNLAAATRVSRQ